MPVYAIRMQTFQDTSLEAPQNTDTLKVTGMASGQKPPEPKHLGLPDGIACSGLKVWPIQLIGYTWTPNRFRVLYHELLYVSLSPSVPASVCPSSW